jgi:hypothetical protein
MARVSRAVHVTYASIEDRDLGLALAAPHPMIDEAVPKAFGYGLHVYPLEPISGRPFALLYGYSPCESVTITTVEPVSVEVAGNALDVTVSHESLVCGVPPPGFFMAMWQIAGVPAGSYSLRLISDESPGYVLAQSDLTVQSQQLAIPSPAQVNALGPLALALLMLAIAAVAIRARP